MAADLASAVSSVHIFKHLNEIFGAARAVGDVEGEGGEGERRRKRGGEGEERRKRGGEGEGKEEEQGGGQKGDGRIWRKVEEVKGKEVKETRGGGGALCSRLLPQLYCNM